MKGAISLFNATINNIKRLILSIENSYDYNLSSLTICFLSDILKVENH